jgi:exodeoxyribonuclease-3
VKLATWNVNSLRVRLSHLLEWLKSCPVDVIGLQETKLVDSDFPHAEIEAAGYQSVFHGQKTYNGVAILSRTALTDVKVGIPGFKDDQCRVIAANAGDVRVVNVYVPNGQSVGSEKYQYKLAWLESLRAHLREELKAHPKLAIVGDFNIAPADEDVHDPQAWKGQVLCSEPEREEFRALLDAGFVDSFRLFEQAPRTFSWWDYRQGAFRRNLGLRIDHVLLSHEFSPDCVGCQVDPAPRKLERPSDHAPVIAELMNSAG